MYSKVCKSIRLHLDVPKCIRMYSDASKVFHSFFFQRRFLGRSKKLEKICISGLTFFSPTHCQKACISHQLGSTQVSEKGALSLSHEEHIAQCVCVAVLASTQHCRYCDCCLHSSSWCSSACF